MLWGLRARLRPNRDWNKHLFYFLQKISDRWWSSDDTAKPLSGEERALLSTWAWYWQLIFFFFLSEMKNGTACGTKVDKLTPRTRPHTPLTPLTQQTLFFPFQRVPPKVDRFLQTSRSHLCSTKRRSKIIELPKVDQNEDQDRHCHPPHVFFTMTSFSFKLANLPYCATHRLPGGSRLQWWSKTGRSFPSWANNVLDRFGNLEHA